MKLFSKKGYSVNKSIGDLFALIGNVQSSKYFREQFPNLDWFAVGYSADATASASNHRHDQSQYEIVDVGEVHPILSIANLAKFSISSGHNQAGKQRRIAFTEESAGSDDEGI
jgi:hypothetical protein